MTPDQTAGRDRRLRMATVTAVALAVTSLVFLVAALAAQQPSPPEAPLAAPTQTSGTPTAGSSNVGGGHDHHGARATATDDSRQGAEYDRAQGPVMDPSEPMQISIPSLDLSTPTIRLGLQEDGTMEVPRAAGRAGWYERSPTPGALGPAVIAAHVTWDKRPDVFFKLGELKPGAKVEVKRKDGSIAVFRVTEVTRYPKKDFPTEQVYGSVDHAALRLITCGGVFDSASGHYVDNVVAFADLVDSRTTG